MGFQKGHKINVGKPCSEETRERISQGHFHRGKTIFRLCLGCKRLIRSIEANIKNGKDKFCSKLCAWEAQKGKPAWNKGLKGFRAGEKRDCMPEGSKHWSWKENGISYSGIHQWIRRELGSANHCEECGLRELPKGKKRYFDWANISHQYKRSLEDWKQLCKKCHRQFDALTNRKVNA